MTQKVDLQHDWKLHSTIEKVIERHCKEIPWEGTEVDQRGILEGIIDLLDSKEYSLLRHTINKYTRENSRRNN